MSFWTIFNPVFAALFGIFLIKELFSIAVSYYFHRKQLKLRKQLEAKIASGEIDPTQIFDNMGFSPDTMTFPPGFPTASGSNGKSPDKVSHGQYL